jgi:hypothetical protein
MPAIDTPSLGCISHRRYGERLAIAMLGRAAHVGNHSAESLPRYDCRHAVCSQNMNGGG